jgi:hypothetical protein
MWDEDGQKKNPEYLRIFLIGIDMDYIKVGHN